MVALMLMMIASRSAGLTRAQRIYLFVCAGNTSRSPMAQAICNDEVARLFGLGGSNLPIVAVSDDSGRTYLWNANRGTRMHVLKPPDGSVANCSVFSFGGGVLFYVLQEFTAAILVLAANTAFNGFPVLASILGRDGYLPRQLSHRGDRLVFSNGIVLLAGVASLLIVVFDAQVNRLIQLYILGVFLSFTLSQLVAAVKETMTKQG